MFKFCYIVLGCMDFLFCVALNAKPTITLFSLFPPQKDKYDTLTLDVH